MSVSTIQRTGWTTSDIALLPDNGTRYEIIDGELYMSRQPHWHHQFAGLRISMLLQIRSVSCLMG